MKTSTLVVLLTLLPMTASRADQRVPDDFEVTTFAGGFAEPLALAVASDSRVFIGEKGGAIWTVAHAGAEPELFAEIDVYDFSECGLLGLAIDGDHVYAFATVSENEQRILRFTDENGVGVDRTVIRDGLPTIGRNHNGGGIRIGPDRKLYFSLGDTDQSELSQKMHTLAGKLCRINLDGTIPDDNPFTTPTGTPRAPYALGLRNPFRFCFAEDGRLFVLDVGSDDPVRREEINLMPRGGNGGWPGVEGEGTAQVVEGTLVQPIFTYNDEGAAPGGCVVYETDAFPDAYRGGLFHLDFVSRRIFHLSLHDDGSLTHTDFGETDSGPVDLAIGPEGQLLYTELFSGHVKQIRYRFATVDDSPPEEPTLEALPTSTTPCGAGIAGMLMISLGGFLVLRLHFIGDKVTCNRPKCVTFR